MRKRQEFWLDNEIDEQNQLITTIKGMKKQRLFSPSVRFGLLFMERLHAHYARKHGYASEELFKDIDYEEAAQVLFDYYYGTGQPVAPTPTPQKETTYQFEDDLSDFNERGFDAGEGDNFDTLFGQSDSFLD